MAAPFNDRIEQDFTYHKPKEGQPEKYQYLRDKAKELAYILYDFTPLSLEQDEAYKHLQEFVMWANAAIARNE